MAPTIHLVRHAQGIHNLLKDYTISDPDLTPHGHDQCIGLRDSFPIDPSKISLVAASPLQRTFETAFLAFGPALTTGGKCPPQILALPDAQETSDDACDTGTDLDVLQEIVREKEWPVDLSMVEAGWNDKALSSRYSPHSDALNARAKGLRVFLRQRLRELVDQGNADAQIVLVSHGSFLHFLTADWEDAVEHPSTGWHNCETRAYVFEHGLGSDDDDMASLTETIASRQRRGKCGPMLSRDEQPLLFLKAMEHWESQGLQRPDKVGMLESSGTANGIAGREARKEGD